MLLSSSVLFFIRVVWNVFMVPMFVKIFLLQMKVLTPKILAMDASNVWKSELIHTYSERKYNCFRASPNSGECISVALECIGFHLAMHTHRYRYNEANDKYSRHVVYSVFRVLFSCQFYILNKSFTITYVHNGLFFVKYFYIIYLLAIRNFECVYSLTFSWYMCVRVKKGERKRIYQTGNFFFRSFFTLWCVSLYVNNSIRWISWLVNLSCEYNIN